MEKRSQLDQALEPFLTLDRVQAEQIIEKVYALE
jgi:hypothetical protein